MRPKVLLIKAKVATHVTPEHSLDDGSGVSPSMRKEIRIPGQSLTKSSLTARLLP